MSKPDIDYEAEGVTPPTVDFHQEGIPMNVRPNWKQKGNFIYREGEELQTASKIPTSHLLIGTDDKGKPILKKIEL